MSSNRFTGASGLVIIKAPPPGLEFPEDPIMFSAETVTNTESVKIRLYGADVSVESGTVQVKLDTIVKSLPSQLTVS